MKTKLLTLMSLLCSLSCFAACGSTPKGKPVNYAIQADSIVRATLGTTMTDILFSPSKVTSYVVKGKSKVEEDDLELEPHYVRDSLIAKLTAEETRILQFVLLADSTNYKQDSVKVRSPYVPVMEICFEKKKQQVHLLLSLSDFSWTIYYDGKVQGNWNYANKPLVKRFYDMLKGKTSKK